MRIKRAAWTSVIVTWAVVTLALAVSWIDAFLADIQATLILPGRTWVNVYRADQLTTVRLVLADPQVGSILVPRWHLSREGRLEDFATDQGSWLLSLGVPAIRPHWQSVPWLLIIVRQDAMLGLMLVVGGVVLVLKRWRHVASARRKKLCVNCGYDLRGQADRDACPECGGEGPRRASTPTPRPHA
ncbi:MAG: hypothetical protein AAFY08_11295 [Planctomycetota bacterium]